MHGLPIGIKDRQETQGVLTTHGSPMYCDHVPAGDSGQVALVRAAGAIVTAKTNVPEFGADANSRNPVWGATGNLFNPPRWRIASMRRRMTVRTSPPIGHWPKSVVHAIRSRPRSVKRPPAAAELLDTTQALERAFAGIAGLARPVPDVAALSTPSGIEVNRHRRPGSDLAVGRRWFWQIQERDRAKRHPVPAIVDALPAVGRPASALRQNRAGFIAQVPPRSCNLDWRS